jgi:hypothetical protein
MSYVLCLSLAFFTYFCSAVSTLTLRSYYTVHLFFSWKDDEPPVPACEGVEAGLPQGEAAGVLLLLGLRLPLLNINKLCETLTSFSFHCWVQFCMQQLLYFFAFKGIQARYFFPENHLKQKET